MQWLWKHERSEPRQQREAAEYDSDFITTKAKIS